MAVQNEQVVNLLGSIQEELEKQTQSLVNMLTSQEEAQSDAARPSKMLAKAQEDS